MSDVPKKHNISGVYIRYKNPITNEMENRVFEDLPEEKMKEVLDGKNEEWVKHMCILMAKCLHTVVEEFDIHVDNPSK